MRYCPAPSVTAVRTFSIRTGLAASTLTPGSTPPDSSLTVPVRVPCANAADGSRRAAIRIKMAFDAQRMVVLLQYGVGSGIQCFLYIFVNADLTRDHRLLDGRALRDRILDEVAQRVRQAAATHTIGRLVSISVGEHKEAGVYVRGQATAATRIGLRFAHETWPSSLTQDECKARLVAMNDDSDVLGVILQRPVPAHINGRSLASAIHPLNDVAGMNPASIGDIGDN